MQSDARAEQAARIDLVFQQMPITLLTTLVNGLLLVAVLGPLVERGWMAAWVATLVLLVTVRFGIWHCYRRTRRADRFSRRWLGINFCGSLIGGVLWGSFCWFLMPMQEPYAAFTALVIGGMSAGAAMVNASHLPTVLAFILPATVPLASRFALQGTRMDVVLAALTMIFAVAMMLAATRVSGLLDHSARTRMDLAQRTAALAEANARLRAEMDEHRATEAALRQAQKMEAIGSLTAGVAHDINNLLMAISGSAELLQRRLDAPKAAPHLAAIFRATDRGARLTRHLLAFARQEVLMPVVVDLNELLMGLTTLLQATLGKSISIDLRLHAELWPVYVDRNEIERALLNLVINARDAMPQGGTLTLSTDNASLPVPRGVDDPPAGPAVVVGVADSGTGMPLHVQERAFDPFFTTKPVGEGSGLGLSQVYGLVRQSGGVTRIDSAMGVGTCVRLYLPRASDAVSFRAEMPHRRGDVAAAAAPQDSAAGLHVVVLDDEEAVMNIVAEMLRGGGYRVSGFSAVDAALACIARDPSVGVFVTDLGMPVRSGDQVAAIARQARPSLPVVFITGYNDPDTLAGERWHLRKPFTAEALVAVVGDAMQATMNEAARLSA